MESSAKFYVYILCNKHRTVLYTGITNNLSNRLREHNCKRYPKSFSARYHCRYLVYYEIFTRVTLAIKREKEIKKWRRDKKNKFIAKFNSSWKFLNNEFPF